jgi:sulfur dioxygenase
MKVGLPQDRDDLREWTLDCERVLQLADTGAAILIDLRDQSERDRHGVIPGSVHAPYSGLTEHLKAGGLLHELARSTDKRLIFYCAYGERSAMAVEAALDAGVPGATHLRGGIAAWKQSDGPLTIPSR